MMRPSWSLLNLVASALEQLYADDYDLIEREINERSIVSRFGRYLESLLQPSEYGTLDLDVEYNRNGQGPKRTKKFINGVYPDLILHERGTNRRNILVIEFKTPWNQGDGEDVQKLQELTDESQVYGYDLGLAVVLGRSLDETTITEVTNGKKASNALGYQDWRRKNGLPDEP